jgi:hypothetical protein
MKTNLIGLGSDKYYQKTELNTYISGKDDSIENKGHQ